MCLTLATEAGLLLFLVALLCRARLHNVRQLSLSLERNPQTIIRRNGESLRLASRPRKDRDFRARMRAIYRHFVSFIR